VLPKFILEPSFAKSGDEKKVRMNRVPQFCTGDEIKSQDEEEGDNLGFSPELVLKEFNP
jgi:hypothetical protein